MTVDSLRGSGPSRRARPIACSLFTGASVYVPCRQPLQVAGQRVVRCVDGGRSGVDDEVRGSADIAARLHLADGTVRNYLSAAIAKLGARNRTEAASLARDRGWL